MQTNMKRWEGVGVMVGRHPQEDRSWEDRIEDFLRGNGEGG